ncbi:MAG: hypothetical protein IJY92_06545 [Alphaproteobacteria bacterium]|nr:hypothetical protein [Alphaproteobacteria bacterium]
MDTAKAEFKSCLTTGVLGFLLSVSIITGAYYFSGEMNKEQKKENTPQKILKPSTQPKKANYWIPQKDR